MPHSRYRTVSGGRCQRRKRRSPSRSSSTCNYTLPSDRKTWTTGPLGTFSTTSSRCPKGSVIAGNGVDGKRWCCALTQSVRRKYAETLVKKGMTPVEAVAAAVAAVPNRVEAAAMGAAGAIPAAFAPSAPPLPAGVPVSRKRSRAGSIGGEPVV